MPYNGPRAPPQIEEWLKFNPETAILMLHSDLVAGDEATLIRGLAGDNGAHYAAIQKQVEPEREELAGSNPSPLERVLIDRIVTSWLQLQMGDQQCLDSKQPSRLMLRLSWYRDGKLKIRKRRILLCFSEKVARPCHICGLVCGVTNC